MASIASLLGSANVAAGPVRIGPTTSIPVGSNPGLEVVRQFTDPNQDIQQSVVFYAFYQGDQGPAAGSFQGGSSEANVFNNGATDYTQSVLGFECIARVGGDQPNRIEEAIGGQGQAYAEGTPTIGKLVALRAAGPQRLSGAGAVEQAISLEVVEPTTGNEQFSALITGRTRLVQDDIAAMNTLELTTSNGTLQWANNGSKVTGYASDGVSERVVLDSGDAPAERIKSSTLGSGKHLSFTNFGADVFSINATGRLRFANASNSQTTIGAAGGAAALPATPVRYLLVEDATGTTVAIPAYTSA